MRSEFRSQPHLRLQNLDQLFVLVSSTHHSITDIKGTRHDIKIMIKICHMMLMTFHGFLSKDRHAVLSCNIEQERMLIMAKVSQLTGYGEHG